MVRYDVSCRPPIVAVFGNESVEVAMPGDGWRHTGLTLVGDVDMVRDMAGMEGCRPCWLLGPETGENK